MTGDAASADTAGIGPVLRRALTRSALVAAYDRVLANRGCAGVDGVSSLDFGVQLQPQLRLLQGEVLARTYKPVPLLRAWLPRPGREPRALGIPAVRDRVLQTAVAESLNPLVEAELESCSYGFRRGRGVRHAVERIQQLQRQGYCWVVDADIEAFFDNIDHAELLTTVGALVPEPRLLELLRTWLQTPIFEDGQLYPVTRGVAQGSPVSPLLANLYLDKLDEALIDARHVMVRYADDFLVLSRTREKAEQALELTTEVLRRLHLRLNPLKTRVVHLDQGLQFLGWNFVRTMAVPARAAAAPLAALPSVRPALRRNLADDAPGSAGVGLNVDRAAEAASAAGFADSVDAIDADHVDEIVQVVEVTASVNAPGTQALADAQDDDPTDALDEDADTPLLPAPVPIQRTLYLLDLQATLACEGGRLKVELDGKTVLSLPAPQVDQVLVFGPVRITTQALHLLLRAGAGVGYLTRQGRYLGRLAGAGEGSLVLAQAQHTRQAAPQFQLAVAQRLVQAKISNSATLLASHQRRYPASARGSHAPRDMRELVRRAQGATSMDQLRGYEGQAAALYWQAWVSMLDPVWGFAGRVPRPAPDPINALMSFGYVLLQHCVAGLLQGRGADVRLGGLHTSFGERESLALDLMEPWRAPVVDTAVWHLVMSGGVTPGDFRTGAGHCRIGDKARRSLIRAFEDRMNTVRQPPAKDEPATPPQDLRRLIDRDLMHYLAAVRSDDAAAFQPTTLR